MGSCVTALELAKALNVSRQTVYRLTQKGQIPAYAVGRCYRYVISEVKEVLAHGICPQARVEMVCDSMEPHREEEKLVHASGNGHNSPNSYALPSRNAGRSRPKRSALAKKIEDDLLRDLGLDSV